MEPLRSGDRDCVRDLYGSGGEYAGFGYVTVGVGDLDGVGVVGLDGVEVVMPLFRS